MISKSSNTHSYNHSRGSVLYSHSPGLLQQQANSVVVQDSALALLFILLARWWMVNWKGCRVRLHQASRLFVCLSLSIYTSERWSVSKGWSSRYPQKALTPSLIAKHSSIVGTFVPGVATFCSSTPLGVHDHCHLVGSEQHQHRALMHWSGVQMMFRVRAHKYGCWAEQLLEFGELLLTWLGLYYLVWAVPLGEVSKGHCDSHVVLYKMAVVSCET